MYTALVMVSYRSKGDCSFLEPKSTVMLVCIRNDVVNYVSVVGVNGIGGRP